MNLDNYTFPGAMESLTRRLWRRYDEKALRLLEDIREDPRQAEVLIEGTEYRRCEIRLARSEEQTSRLGDFLRRRSKIALVVRREDIRRAPGLMGAREILFDEQAREKFDEYFQEPLAVEKTDQPMNAARNAAPCN